MDLYFGAMSLDIFVSVMLMTLASCLASGVHPSRKALNLANKRPTKKERRVFF